MKTTYKIERNIPQSIVSKLIVSPAQAVFPYTRMNKGDSFLFDRKISKSVGFTSATFGRKNSMKFITKYNGEKGRCWRVK